MNVSEVEKTLTDAYYWLSMYKSGAITEGVAMEKVKKAIFAQPQLNENQQIVLDWLKQEWQGRKRHTWLSLECIATLVYHWQNGDPDYYPSHAAPHVEAYGELTAVEHLEILQVFSQWALEQEEAV